MEKCANVYLKFCWSRNMMPNEYWPAPSNLLQFLWDLYEFSQNVVNYFFKIRPEWEQNSNDFWQHSDLIEIRLIRSLCNSLRQSWDFEDVQVLFVHLRFQAVARGVLLSLLRRIPEERKGNYNFIIFIVLAVSAQAKMIELFAILNHQACRESKKSFLKCSILERLYHHGTYI